MLKIGLSAAVLVGACGGSGPSVGPSATPAASPPVAASPTPSASPSPSAATPTTPPELRGRWGTRVRDESVVLTLDGDSYMIKRGPNSAHGHIVVEGDEITFDTSSLCVGIGRYRWTIADERLRFEEIAPDECPGRTEVLIGPVYGNRSDP